jgi:hypothetical protein
MKNEAVGKHKPRAKKGTTEIHEPPVTACQPRTIILASAVSGILVGFLILYFHLFNYIFINYLLSEKVTFINWYPATFEFLNRLSGIFVLTLSVTYLLYALFWKEVIDSFLTNHYRRLLILLISGIGILAIFVCVNKIIHLDEIEHMHSAWYIKNGYIPYRDFFEHHNPLLWYLLLPFLYLSGDSVNTLLIARLFMFCITLGIIYCTYLIASTVSNSKETGLVSVLLMFSTVLLMEKVIEIRPDVPQVLFGMISVYFLIRFSRNRRNNYMFLSGFSAAISFLFLQKAIFLLVAYGVILAYGIFKREISGKNILCFMGGLLVPLLSYGAYLLMTGSLHDYFLTNWQLNWHFLGSRAITANPLRTLSDSLGSGRITVKPSRTLSGSLIPNLPFWILAVSSVFYLMLKKDICKEIKFVVIIGLVQITSLSLYSVTFKHYYLFSVCLFSVSGAFFLTKILDAGKIIITHRVALSVAILLWAVPFLLIDNLNSNRFQLEKIKYVLSMTKDTDLVYDGANNFNLFRHDLHYFWFQLVQMKSYNKQNGNRFGDYDGCSLIRAKRPKVINELHIDFNSCGLDALYYKTKYPGVYIRKEPESNAR